MTTAQLQQSEKQFEQAVVDYSKLMDWLSYHALNSRGSEAGFPDRVFVRDGRLLFVEFKTEGGRASSAQHRWLEALGRVVAGREGPVEVHLWRPRHWDRIVEVLR